MHTNYFQPNTEACQVLMERTEIQWIQSHNKTLVPCTFVLFHIPMLSPTYTHPSQLVCPDIS